MSLKDRFKEELEKFKDSSLKVAKKAGDSILEEYEKGLGLDSRKKKREEELGEKFDVPKVNKKGATLYGKAKTGVIRRNLYFPYGDWRHKLIVGGTGSGKNTWAENFVVNCPHGVAFLDNAKGSSVDNILRASSNEQLKKTIVLDHSIREQPLAVATVESIDNIFENDMLVSQWEDFFISNFDIGDKFRTRKVIRNALKAVFGVDNMTVLDAVEFVRNQDFRTYILNKLLGEDYRDVKRYWNEFDEMSDSKQLNYIEPFLNRTGNIKGDTILKTTLGQIPKEKLDYEKWVNENYKVLIKIPEKQLPAEAVRIISSLHMLNFWRACLSRGDVFDQPSKQFTVICDEPQGWLGKNTKVLDNIFSKARAYRMNVMCLIQSTEQIKDESSKLLNVILHNQPDIIALSYADIDGFRNFDWQNLSDYSFLARVNSHKFVGKSLKPVTSNAERPKKEALAFCSHMRDKYNRHYLDVLNRIERRHRRWEEGASVIESQSQSESLDSGTKTTSSIDSQTKTSESSDSSIITNW
ncbi:hypothetical protein MWH25_10375 [Natroniella acetigena]|uniref:hypothetical protein n=1 Tax=Natroniella acetigena TaxID=52004 RepID=UPI00200A5163|nr:hypothetical protein [Natroniella acetigena]MCK8828136.1 hypothetical protein [Natroniella acetigena]